MQGRIGKRKAGMLVLAAILALSHPAGIFAESLKEAQQEKENLENALKEAQDLIDNLKDSKENIGDKVSELDGKLTQISTDITNLEQQLKEKGAEISDVKDELSQAEKDEQVQYENMKLRIRYMYENSRTSYIARILSAESFSEFLNEVEYIQQISKYDRQMLEKYKKTQDTVKDTKVVLEEEQAQLQQMQAKVKEEKQAVQELLTAKETELAAVNLDLKEANQQADVFAAEIQAQNEIIEQIKQVEAAKKAAREKAEAEAKARAEAAAAAGEAENGTEEGATEEDSYFGGTFAWPCPSSTRVTSDYGKRESPTAGASSDHKGIDIGAAYGADIVAAADGTVVFSGYSNSAGNYVMIDHGGSLYTVYMHASSLCVDKDTEVTKGQPVAKVGSTGISTGNHLHFGVSLNGSYVSPWNYLGR